MQLCKGFVTSALVFLVSCGGRTLEGSDTAGPASGTIDRWAETTGMLVVENGAVSLPCGGFLSAHKLIASWSLRQLPSAAWGAGTGWFYRGNEETTVAFAGESKISPIRDATAFDYSQRYAGPVPEGSIVLFRHAESGTTLAVRVERITPGEIPWPIPDGTSWDGCKQSAAYAEITWYLLREGQTSFAGFSDL
jgi:hypothetical protein